MLSNFDDRLTLAFILKIKPGKNGDWNDDASENAENGDEFTNNRD